MLKFSDRTILHLLLALSCIAALSSCKEMVLSKQVKEFMGKTIVIPDSLLIIQGGNIAMKESDKLTHPILIVYVDENSCTSCKISHLIEYSEGTTLFSANIEALAEQEEVVVTCSAGISGYCFEKITAWPLCKCVWTGRPKDYCDCDNTGFIG